MNKKIYIAALFALGLTAQPAAFAQTQGSTTTAGVTQNYVSGLLTEPTGDPIIGAAVKVVGTNRAAISDIDGRYRIQANPGETLEFSYIGCVTTEHKVKKGQDTFNLVMEPSVESMEEVVVIGYGKQKKESMVSSVSSIGAAQLSVKTANLTNNVAGKLPGLIAVQRSGEPGWDSATFYIRGISSYAGGTDPLVLVFNKSIDATV